MNGVHDMGGFQGFGPVAPEADEPLFHAPWERRALGLTLAMGASGQWNIDLSRAARESLPPATYLGSSYYEIWIRGLEKLMLQRGLVTAADLGAALAEVAPWLQARPEVGPTGAPVSAIDLAVAERPVGEWLLPHPVAGEGELTSLPVPEGQGEYPAKAPDGFDATAFARD